jgi:integrase
MTTRRRYQKNNGFRKVCGCSRKKWPVCPHAYNVNYRGVRISLDEEAGRHLEYRDAQELANTIRGEIDAGTFVSRRKRTVALIRPTLTVPDIDPGGMTVDALADRYFAQARNRLTGDPLLPRERANWDKFATFLVTYQGLPTRLGSMPAAMVTDDHVRQFYEHQATLRTATVANGKSKKGTLRNSYARTVGGPSSANRTGDRAATVFKWAAQHHGETGVERSPFRDRAGDRVVAKYGELGRDRRLEAGEEEALLAAASPELRLCIIGALESTLRVGELLNLRWRRVDFNANVITLRGRKNPRTQEGTKTRKDRLVPITARMRVVLEFLAIGPDGKPHHPSGYVFGDATTGEKRRSLATQWTTCRLKASGFTGQIRTGAHARLTPAARTHLRDYDLQWRDLRREGASSHVDRGMRMPEVQAMLGHASLTTTTRYVRPKAGWAQEAAQRVDAHPDSQKNLQKIADELAARKAAKLGGVSKSVN